VDAELSDGEWTLDTTASSIGFQAKAAFGMKVNGRFGRYESTITIGSSVSESTVSATIWTDSVDTGIKLRDEHLRADNVFASATFSTLEFSSTAVVETPTGLDITGTLRIRDTSQSVTFEATRSTTAGPPPLHGHRGRVTQGVRDHPMGHYQAGQGHPRRHPDAGLTRVGLSGQRWICLS